MCSIAGMTGAAVPEDAAQIVQQMNQCQQHRGPDDSGIARLGAAVLGHRRLSIIDLSGGAQPMTNEDETLTLVFNGEIYNYPELREFLLARNHQFRTRSDTEVILHLYEEYGDQTPEHLAGMFAFALWDAPRQKLLLARDRAGQKPLHYFTTPDGGIVFASELAALRKHPDFPEEMDPDAVSDFLSFQSIPAPRTVYRHVRKLPPAHSLVWQAETGLGTPECYWKLDFSNKCGLTFDQAAEHLQDLVYDAVKRRLMADVPMGVFLSGGMDSAIIAAAAAELRAPERTEAFTIGFAERAYDERSGAALSADFINRHTGGLLDRHEKIVDAGSFDRLDALIRQIGEPFADASILPTAFLSEFARERVTVALSGDAADELFAGYERYLAMRMLEITTMLPEQWRGAFFRKAADLLPDSGERSFAGRLRRLIHLAGEPDHRQYFAVLDRCPPPCKRLLAGDLLSDAAQRDSCRLFAAAGTAQNRIEQCMETDFHTYLSADILTKVDIASMASSLEVRNPYLDHRIIEFAASLPVTHKVFGSTRKRILGAAFADRIPPEILRGRKRGFGVPVASWLRDRWRKPAEEAILDGAAVQDGWIRKEAAEHLWQEHLSGKRDHSYCLYNLLIFSLFLANRK